MNGFVEAQLAYIGDHRRLLQGVFELIQMARHSIVLQMYLFMANGQATTIQPLANAFPKADTIAGWLIAKKRKNPAIKIVVILDTQTPDETQIKNHNGRLIRQKLAAADIVVLNANLFGARFDRNKKRPRQLLFHDHWRRQTDHSRWVSCQNRWQILHNVEDHRKNLVIDGGAWALLTSHNFMDAACYWHENAFVFDGAAARQLWQQARQALTQALAIPQKITEPQKQAVQDLAADTQSESPAYSARPSAPELASYPICSASGTADFEFVVARQRVLDTLEILPQLLKRIAAQKPGESILVAVAYFSDWQIWQELRQAGRRGVKVKILVDDMRALPLRWFLQILVRAFVNRSFLEWARDQSDVEVRVHHSRNFKMMHLKTVAFLSDEPVLIGGQANYTPRSFNGAWFESDIEIANAEIVGRFVAHFEELWRLPESRPPSKRNLRNKISGKFYLAVLKAFSWIGLEL